MKRWFVFITLLCSLLGQAQPYSIGWYKVAGGGGASTGTNGTAVYSINGTIGQQDASTVMAGGSYSVTGGFWSFISLVQMAGAPTLSIARSGNSAIISWPYPSTGFFLQTNSNLVSPAWMNFSGTIVSNVSGSNSVTITPPVGNLFFRLGP